MSSRVTLSHKNEDVVEGFPSNTIITMEFDCSDTMSELVEGFRMFAAAIGYGEKTINKYLGEE